MHKILHSEYSHFLGVIPPHIRNFRHPLQKSLSRLAGAAGNAVSDVSVNLFQTGCMTAT